MQGIDICTSGRTDPVCLQYSRIAVTLQLVETGQCTMDYVAYISRLGRRSPGKQDLLGWFCNPIQLGGEVEVRAQACYSQFCDNGVKA